MASNKRELQPLRLFNVSDHAMQNLKNSCGKPSSQHPTSKVLSNSGSLKDRRALAKQFRGYFKAGSTFHGYHQVPYRADGYGISLDYSGDALDTIAKQLACDDKGVPVLPKSGPKTNLLKAAVLKRARDSCPSLSKDDPTSGQGQDDCNLQWLPTDIDQLMNTPGHQLSLQHKTSHQEVRGQPRHIKTNFCQVPKKPKNRTSEPNFHRCVFLPHDASEKQPARPDPQAASSIVQHNALLGGKSQAVSRQVLNKYRQMQVTCQHSDRPRLRTTACQSHSVPRPATNGNLAFISVSRPLTLLNHPAHGGAESHCSSTKPPPRPEVTPRLPEISPDWSCMLTRYMGQTPTTVKHPNALRPIHSGRRRRKC